MISVSYHCNLDDVLRYEKFPAALEFRPQVGDYVRSSTKWPRYYNGRGGIELQVCGVTITGESSIEVELHLIPSRFENITSWENWYNKVRGF